MCTSDENVARPRQDNIIITVMHAYKQERINFRIYQAIVQYDT